MWDAELIFVFFPIIQCVVILSVRLLEKKNLILVRQAL